MGLHQQWRPSERRSRRRDGRLTRRRPQLLLLAAFSRGRGDSRGVAWAGVAPAAAVGSGSGGSLGGFASGASLSAGLLQSYICQ